MSDKTPENSDAAEAERIRKWRADRVAAAQKVKQEQARVVTEKPAPTPEYAGRKPVARFGDVEPFAAFEKKTGGADGLLPSAEAIQATKAKIRKRKRKATVSLILQIVVFVLLPTALVVGYLSERAVPLYEAKSVITIIKPGTDNGGGLGGLLGVVGGAGGGEMSETFMANAYIKSKALIDQLEDEMGLVSMLSGPDMDPYTRLRDVPFLSLTKEDGFSRFVFSSIDIQTGLLSLYVRAPSPEMAIDVSNAVLELTATQINQISEKLFKFRTDVAQRSVDEARVVLTNAQRTLTQLQIDSGEANPAARVEGIYATITKLETDMAEIEAQIQRANVSGQSENLITQRLYTLKENMQALADQQRARLISPPSNGQRSLNQLLLDYELAALQLRIAEETLLTAFLALEKASDDAALAQSQFLVVVPPKTSAYATLPNIPKTGFVAFLTFLSVLSLFRLMPSSRRG